MKKQMTTLALALSIIFMGMGYVSADELKTQNTPPIKIEHKKFDKAKFEQEHLKRIDEFNKELGLTEAQIAKINDLKLKTKEKMKPLKEKQKAKFDEIKKIRDNDNLTIKVQDKKIEQIKEELKLINQDMRQIMQDERKAFKSILTDEQKVKLEQMKSKNLETMKAHKKRHRGYRPHHIEMYHQ